MNMEVIEFSKLIIEVLFIIMVLGLAGRVIEIQREKNYLNDKLINLQSEINPDKIFEMLDSIIANSISEYVIMNGIDQSTYIDTESEKELKTFVTKSVSERMSDALYQRVNMVFAEESIPDIIAKRVFIKTSLYVANNNSASKTKNKP